MKLGTGAWNSNRDWTPVSQHSRSNVLNQPVVGWALPKLTMPNLQNKIIKLTLFVHTVIIRNGLNVFSFCTPKLLQLRIACPTYHVHSCTWIKAYLKSCHSPEDSQVQITPIFFWFTLTLVLSHKPDLPPLFQFLPRYLFSNISYTYNFFIYVLHLHTLKCCSMCHCAVLTILFLQKK